jgi:hypothetical protein
MSLETLRSGLQDQIPSLLTQWDGRAGTSPFRKLGFHGQHRLEKELAQRPGYHGPTLERKCIHLEAWLHVFIALPLKE